MIFILLIFQWSWSSFLSNAVVFQLAVLWFSQDFVNWYLVMTRPVFSVPYHYEVYFKLIFDPLQNDLQTKSRSRYRVANKEVFINFEHQINSQITQTHYRLQVTDYRLSTLLKHFYKPIYSWARILKRLNQINTGGLLMISKNFKYTWKEKSNHK